MQYSSQMQDKGGYYDKQGPYQGEGSSSNYPNNTPPKEQRIFVGNVSFNYFLMVNFFFFIKIKSII